MKQTIIPVLLLLLLLIGCKSTGSSTEQAACRFSKTLVGTDSLLQTKFPADTVPTYTYKTYSVNFDSLLQSLCTAGFRIKEAWNSAPNHYLCKDAIGPRPVILIVAPDPNILGFGFVEGNSGRLACSDSLHYYTPQ